MELLSHSDCSLSAEDDALALEKNEAVSANICCPSSVEVEFVHHDCVIGSVAEEHSVRRRA